MLDSSPFHTAAEVLIPGHHLAILTGTSSGIGLELATQLLDRNWEVIGIARRPPSLARPGYTHLARNLGEVSTLSGWVDTELAPRIQNPGLARLALVNNAADVALLGQADQIDATALLQAYAVNSVAPVILIGALLRLAASTVPIRIVNLSSGAAVEPLPGLGAYGATKAALRMAGMIVAAELDMRAARDVTIWSYEPGVVETPMQAAVRGASAEVLPIVEVFHQLAANHQLLPVQVPAAEIVGYLESDGHPRFAEKRFLLS